MNILKSQKSEIILTIVVNFLSDLIPQFLFLLEGGYIEELPLPIENIIFLIVCLRIIVLPIYYGWLEKSTQNEAIRTFIENLRYNFKTKLVMLFPVSLILTNINICFLIKGKFYIFSDLVGLSLISIFLGSMGNYLALFTFWFIVDLYKKKKQGS